MGGGGVSVPVRTLHVHVYTMIVYVIYILHREATNTAITEASQCEVHMAECVTVTHVILLHSYNIVVFV